MAIRTWSRSLLVALGVSLLAGAGELGVAYGLGILRFTRPFGDVAGHWSAHLVWVAWFAIQATVVGALFADRYARQRDLPATAAVRVTIVAAATMGATVVAPLSMLPASNAQVPSVDPVPAVAVSALFGTLAGAVAALAALRHTPVRWNVTASAAVVWLLALLSVVPSLGAAESLPAVRLGTVDAAWLSPDTAGRLALLLLPGVALLAGAVVATVARRRGQPLVVAAASGVAGPLLIAVAYLLAGPGRGDGGYQFTPYRAALLAVLVGAAGAAAASAPHWPSVLAVILRRGFVRTSAVLSRRPAPPRSSAIEPTEILRPLPVEPAPPAYDASPAAPAPTLDADPVSVSAAATTPAPAPLPEPAPVPAPAPEPAPTPAATPEPAPAVEPGSATRVGAHRADATDRTAPVAPRDPLTPDSRVTTPAGWDWPSPPGSAQAVSTGKLDWSLPPAQRAAGRTTEVTDPTEPFGTTTTTGDLPNVDAPAQRSESTAPAGGTPLTGGLRRLRGLLRRDGTAAEGAREEPALPPQDEEYVDWVTQLGKLESSLTGDRGVRRTLRSGGLPPGD